MKLVLAVVAAVAIFAVGVYVDLSWFLIGGIEQIIHGAQTTPVNGHDIAVGVVRFLLSGLATWLTVVVGIFVIALGRKS